MSDRPIQLEYQASSPSTRLRPRWGVIALCFAAIAISIAAVLRAGTLDRRIRVISTPAQNYSNVRVLTIGPQRIALSSFGRGVVDTTNGQPIDSSSLTIYLRLGASQPQICPVGCR